MKIFITKLAIVLGMMLIVFSCSSSDDPPVDPCANVVCYNGGHCDSGLCQCPTGYTGTDCSSEVNPSKIKISKVVIDNFPGLTSDGNFWDTFATGNYVKPDIFLELYDGNNLLFTTEDAIINDADLDFYYTITFNPPIVINHVNTLHDISLFDKDNGTYDFMASQYFTPYLNGEGFPEILPIVNVGQNFKVEFHLTYEW